MFIHLLSWCHSCLHCGYLQLFVRCMPLQRMPWLQMLHGGCCIRCRSYYTGHLYNWWSTPPALSKISRWNSRNRSTKSFCRPVLQSIICSSSIAQISALNYFIWMSIWSSVEEHNTVSDDALMTNDTCFTGRYYFKSSIEQINRSSRYTLQEQHRRSLWVPDK